MKTQQIFLLLCLNLAIIVPAIIKTPIYRTQEARVAVSAREVLQNKQWLFPTLNGKPRFEKPPLMVWLVASSYAISGKINEITARIPSVIFSCISGLLIFIFARSVLHSEQVAFYSALIQLTAFEFIRESTFAEIDIAFQLVIAIAIYCFYYSFDSNVSRTKIIFSLLGFIFTGIAVNFKGPAAIPLAFLPPLAFWVIKKKVSDLPPLWSILLGVLLFSVIAFWWFGIAIIKSNMAANIFTHELDVTFVSGADHSNPIYYYAYSLFRNFAPWTVLFYFAVGWLIVKKQKNDAEVFLLCWFLSAFLLLSLTPNKQAHYSILLFAPASIITAKIFLLETLPFNLNKIFKPIAWCTVGTICSILWFVPISLLQPNATLAKEVAEELKKQQAKYTQKIPIYTVKYLDIPLVFYYGEPIEKVADDKVIELLKQNVEAFLVVKKKIKHHSSYFEDQLKDKKNYELKAGNESYSIFKIP